MTKELQIAIDNLYSTFSRYPLNAAINGCPCCVSDSDKEKIHTKPLHLLEENDLSRYAFKAISTWGGVEDFKHYLPRIFELLSTTNFIVDTLVILGKLSYANWSDWPDDEQEAIRSFLLAWWSDLIKNKSGFDKEAFIGIYKLIGSIRPLLHRWNPGFDDNSFSNYIELVHDYYHDLVDKKTSFKEMDNDSVNQFLDWIVTKKEIIEQGFFRYEKTEPEFAEKISTTLYIVEHIGH